MIEKWGKVSVFVENLKVLVFKSSFIRTDGQLF